MQIPSDVQQAFEVACAAQTRAHAPYSKFKVGAALKLLDRATAVAGCNVENASYGATVCAERTAIQSATAQFGKSRPEFLVVVVGSERASPPCALCLQVLAEFAGDELPIYLGNRQGIQSRHTLGELLPYPFRSFTVGDQE